ncbi:MAG: hypothetical protein AAF414_16505 [Pseudomonadota bacterium]
MNEALEGGQVYAGFWQAVYDFQTLIIGVPAVLVGVATVLAAYFTIRRMGRQIAMQGSQIEVDQSRHDDAKRSAAWQARAGLPHALSDICEFATNYLKFVRDGKVDRPDPPEEATRIVIRAIGHLEPRSAKTLWELANEIQTFRARLDAEGGLRGDDQYFCLALYFLAENIFEFARGQTEIVRRKSFGREEAERVYHVMLPDAPLDSDAAGNRDLREAIERFDASRQ